MDITRARTESPIPENKKDISRRGIERARTPAIQRVQAQESLSSKSLGDDQRAQSKPSSISARA